MQAKQRGNAILLAILIVTICAMVVTEIVDNQSIQIMRTEGIINQARMQSLSNGVELWANKLLVSDIYKNEVNDKTILLWPKVLRETTIDGAQIQGTLYDAQSLFNLNNLSSNDQNYGFYNMLNALIPGIDQQMVNDLIVATAAWISPSGVKSDVASESYYLDQTPSYQAAHQYFISPSEWRSVKGVTPELYFKLSPYLMALPTVTPVNVNTASNVVLQTISDKITGDDTQKIIEERQQLGGFESDQQFLQFTSSNNIPVNYTLITTESEYFLLRTDIKYHNQNYLMFTLLDRKKSSKDNKPIFKLTVLWKSIGML